MMLKICSLIVFLVIFHYSGHTQSFDGNKPAIDFLTVYSQTFDNWNRTKFYDQWDAVTGLGASDIVNGYIQFKWVDKRIIRSRNAYTMPYVFSAHLDYSDGSNSAGLVIRLAVNGPFEADQEPAIADKVFSREGVAFYPTVDGHKLIVQFPGNDYGTGKTVVTKIEVPLPIGMANLLAVGGGIFRIEDFGTSIYVYYNGAALTRIDLSGLKRNKFTSGKVFNSNMQLIGSFSGLEVEVSGKVAIAQNDASLKLYNVSIEKKASTAPSVHYKIFVLAGQSNMVGMAPNVDFSAEYQDEQTNVQIWAGMNVDASLEYDWINVKPGFGFNLLSSGCELSFANEIAKLYPNEHIRLIKGAWCATTLAEDWVSRSVVVSAKMNLYHKLINEIVNPALNNIIQNGGTYDIAGFLWMQGESDGMVLKMANNYESNLSSFIQDIRNDLGVENLPFVIAKIDSIKSWPYHSIVRQAEDNVAARLKNVGIFDTKGFETDGAHFLATGYIKLGKAFTKAIQNLIPKVYVSQIWDDAILNDLRLIQIIKKYHGKATFAVDAGNITDMRQPNAWVVNGTAFGKVSIDDIKNIYSEFEIANHGLYHKELPQLSDSALNNEIVESKRLLELWLNRPIKGFVYPGCPYDSVSKKVVIKAGHQWARTCENTADFWLNTDPFEMRTTVPFNAPNFWQEFERIKTIGGVFTFWGHTFFTTEAEWIDIEDKIARLSHDPAVVWVNTSDLFNKAQ